MNVLLERWFAVASTNWSPTTVRQTRSVLDRHLIPRLGHIGIGVLTTDRIDGLYAELSTSGTDKGGLAPGTVKRVHVVLRSALAQAVRWGWIFDNPAERAHRIVDVGREPSPPTPAELRTLLASTCETNPDLHMFFVLAATTGARRAQLLALRWNNIDTVHRSVSFTSGWVDGPDGPVLAPTKTKRRHSVELDADTTRLMEEHRRRCAAKARVASDGFVFSSDRSGRVAWRPNWVTKAFLRALRACDLRPFRLHDLRHFMATEMLQAGVPLVVVSRRLDHQRVSTTLDFYAHRVPGSDANAAETINNILTNAS